jgi:hypothetical protein
MKVKIVKMINSGSISNCGEGFHGGVNPRTNPGIMYRQALRAYSFTSIIKGQQKCFVHKPDNPSTLPTQALLPPASGSSPDFRSVHLPALPVLHHRFSQVPSQFQDRDLLRCTFHPGPSEDRIIRLGN